MKTSSTGIFVVLTKNELIHQLTKKIELLEHVITMRTAKGVELWNDTEKWLENEKQLRIYRGKKFVQELKLDNVENGRPILGKVGHQPLKASLTNQPK